MAKRYRLNRRKAARFCGRAVCVAMLAALVLALEFYIIDSAPDHITTRAGAWYQAEQQEGRVKK